ncbi:right-handed parallel beta-helix repeat-containing protein [Loktanella sp. R86503]|uniref:right-handed parallel beta-helix repeat-containing protein n=1 Tax=Loktanella sp. R86503 TaxID=3093847 RepID=UPI0036D980E2
MTNVVGVKKSAFDAAMAEEAAARIAGDGNLQTQIADLAAGDIRPFLTEAAMLAATDVVANQRAQVAGREWIYKPLGTYTASPTVKNGAAFQLVSTSLTQDCTFAEDTRPIAFLRSVHGSSTTVRLTYAGFNYFLDLTQATPTGIDTRVTTDGGVKVSVIPANAVWNIRAFGGGLSGVDQRPIIEKAIDAANAAGGGTVYLPYWTAPYLISSKKPTGGGKHCIEVKAGVSLIGEGVGLTEVKAADSLGVNQPLIWFDAVGIEVAHMTVNGNRYGRGLSYWADEDEGIDGKLGCGNIHLHHLRIINCGQDAIDIDSCTDGLIEWVDAANCGGFGMHLTGEGDANRLVRMNVRDCTITDCGDLRDPFFDTFGIDMERGDDCSIERVVITGCQRGLATYNNMKRFVGRDITLINNGVWSLYVNGNPEGNLDFHGLKVESVYNGGIVNITNTGGKVRLFEPTVNHAPTVPTNVTYAIRLGGAGSECHNPTVTTNAIGFFLAQPSAKIFGGEVTLTGTAPADYDGAFIEAAATDAAVIGTEFIGVDRVSSAVRSGALRTRIQNVKSTGFNRLARFQSGANNGIAIGNHAVDPKAEAIQCQSGSSGNLVTGNNATGAASLVAYVDQGTNQFMANDVNGKVTEKWGTFTIADGSATVLVTHGLAVNAGALVRVKMANSATGVPVWVSDASSTQITISRSATVGTLSGSWFATT